MQSQSSDLSKQCLQWLSHFWIVYVFINAQGLEYIQEEIIFLNDFNINVFFFLIG